MKSNTFIIIFLILFIFLTIFFVLKNSSKKIEGYLPISDDVAINVLLPTLDLQDLIKLNNTDVSSKPVIQKFINKYLRLEGTDLCSLKSTTYMTKIMPELTKIEYPPLRNNSKPYFDLEFFKNWSMDLLFNSFKNLDPRLNFIKIVENEWLIYDDFLNLDKNVITDSVLSKKNQNLSYYVKVETDYFGFVELKVFIKNGVLPKLHSYFTDKVNEVEMWKETKTFPKGYFWENNFVDFQEEFESSIEQGITQMNEGTLYTFMIFLNVFSSLVGYNKYLEYLEGLEERKEMEKDLDEIFSDSDDEKEPFTNY
jgi:hypothetical protein